MTSPNNQTINLKKKQVINLQKHRPGLSCVCIGVNWGQKQTQVNRGGLFGIGGKTVTVATAVDLDLSAGLLDAQGLPAHTAVSFKNQRSPGVCHSGDDRSGDVVNDNIDNEVITIDFSRVSDAVTHIPVVLNDFRRELKNFGELPHLGIRIYEGTPTRVDNIIATFDIKANEDLRHAQALILGNFSRVNNEFQFEAIGKSASHTSLENLISCGFDVATK